MSMGLAAAKTRVAVVRPNRIRLRDTEEEAIELVGDVGEGAPGRFEAATVAEDDGEGAGRRWGEVDFDEGGGRGTAAVGVEGREGEVMGGAEGGAGSAAGLVGGKELLNLDGGAAGKVGLGHHPTKSDLRDDVNHGVSRSHSAPAQAGRR